MWFPNSYDEICQREDCLYHATRPLYGCDYCELVGKCKTLSPEYERKHPTTEGCSLFTPTIKGYKEQKRAERMQKEMQRIKAIKQLKRLFPHLYGDDYNE